MNPPGERVAARPPDARAVGGADAPLHLLVVDKTSVVVGNRQRWSRLCARIAVDLTLLTVREWVENTRRVEYAPAPGEAFRTVVGHVSWPGHEIKSIYYTGVLEALRISKPDVILLMEEAFSLFALQVTMAAKVLAPKARIIFYGAWINPYSENYFRPKLLFRAVGRLVMSMSDMAFGLNERASEMIRRAGFEHVRTNFFGIDEQIFHPVDQSAARRHLGIPLDEDRILYAGRLRPEKNVPQLLEAFARLVERRPERPLRLVIIGTGEQAPELRRLVALRGLADRVELRDAVDIADMPEVIGAASMLVLPSSAFWAEQFGRVLAEGMLVGTTVVGSNSGEIPTVIGDGGFVFDADDVDALERALLSVLDDPQEADRRRSIAHARAVEHYSMSAFIDNLIQGLDAVVGVPIARTRAQPLGGGDDNR